MNECSYEDIFFRNTLLWGAEAQEKLRNSRVLLAGLGGVGSYVAEALARAGVGALTLLDFDTVELSNINRQLPAILSTVGRPKTEVVAERLAQINPECRVTLHKLFITEDNAASLGDADYFVDAIDHVPGKLAIVTHALALGKPVASAMGAGRRIAPEQLRLADIAKTAGCPLARIMRRELRQRGITSGVTVVYSEEAARRNTFTAEPQREGGKTPLGSCVFVPAVAGMLLASAVVRDLCGFGR